MHAATTMRAASPRVEFVPGEVPALLGLTAMAIYGCVPETDQMPTIGWMIVGLFAIEVVTRTTSAVGVHTLAAAIVLWSGVYGATGRGSAIVGAWFAFWPLVLVVGSMLAFNSQPPRRWVIGLIGGMAAIAVARTGAIDTDTTPALVAVAVAAPVSIAAAWAVARLSVGADDSTSRR
jgi:hypothetical protein